MRSGRSFQKASQSPTYTLPYVQVRLIMGLQIKIGIQDKKKMKKEKYGDINQDRWLKITSNKLASNR